MSLVSPDSNEIGRYAGTTSLTTTVHQLLNLGLDAVSAAFSKFVRTRTVFKRASGVHASGTSFAAITLATAVLGSAFTRSGSVYTCVTPGEYRITLVLSFAGSATGTRGVRLLGSGALGSRQKQETVVGSLAFSMVVEWCVTLAANDTITTQAQQNSGGDLDVTGHLVFDRVI